MRQTGPIQTISDQVYSILRRKICEGEYAPGSWLQEVDLCDQLGVSRSPVREALRRLVSDGLVINIPNKGTFVKSSPARTSTRSSTCACCWRATPSCAATRT